MDDVAEIDYTVTEGPLFTSEEMVAGLKVTNLVQSTQYLVYAVAVLCKVLKWKLDVSQFNIVGTVSEINLFKKKDRILYWYRDIKELINLWSS